MGGPTTVYRRVTGPGTATTTNAACSIANMQAHGSMPIKASTAAAFVPGVPPAAHATGCAHTATKPSNSTVPSIASTTAPPSSSSLLSTSSFLSGTSLRTTIPSTSSYPGSSTAAAGGIANMQTLARWHIKVSTASAFAPALGFHRHWVYEPVHTTAEPPHFEVSVLRGKLPDGTMVTKVFSRAHC